MRCICFAVCCLQSTTTRLRRKAVTDTKSHRFTYSARAGPIERDRQGSATANGVTFSRSNSLTARFIATSNVPRHRCIAVLRLRRRNQKRASTIPTSGNTYRSVLVRLAANGPSTKCRQKFRARFLTGSRCSPECFAFALWTVTQASFAASSNRHPCLSRARRRTRTRGAKFGFRKADGLAWIQPPQLRREERVSISTTFLETRIASGQMGARRNALIARLLRSGVFTNARFIWQTVSYEWDTRLLAFDADVQEVFLTSTGIASRGTVFLIVEILLAAIALLAIYFAWMQLRTRSRVDRVKALYEYFCRKTARLGVPRDPCEGPLDFARRAAQSLPNESNRIRQIADTYILLRYAPQPAPGILDRFAKEVNAFGARTRH